MLFLVALFSVQDRFPFHCGTYPLAVPHSPSATNGGTSRLSWAKLRKIQFVRGFFDKLNTSAARAAEV